MTLDFGTTLGGAWFPSPIFTASGCASSGKELAQFFPLREIGAVVTKSIMLKARAGRPTPRMAETPSGMLNSIGLQGPGIDAFLIEDIPWLASQGARIIVSIAGETDLEKGLQKGIDAKDSVGGIVACNVQGLPLGLGEPFFDSVESLLSHAVFSIPAVRGIDFGAGFEAANMFGSAHNDAIVDAAGKTATNHAGGVVGGITNGNTLQFKIAIKPTSSTHHLS